MRISRKLTITLVCVMALLSLGIYHVFSSSGDAEFWRTRNFVPFEMLRTMGIDVMKTRNYQAHELLRTMGIDLLKLRNYQSFELTRTMNVDVTKLRNYQAFGLLRTMNVDVTKLRNYQAFLMLDPEELELAIDIGPILVTDQNGSIQNIFNLGDIVQFEFVVENIGNTTLTNGLISVEIINPSEIPVFLNYFYETLPPGAHEEYVVGYSIPWEWSTGTYTVKVMAFTKWPSQGGEGLDVETSTFEVT